MKEQPKKSKGVSMLLLCICYVYLDWFLASSSEEYSAWLTNDI